MQPLQQHALVRARVVGSYVRAPRPDAGRSPNWRASGTLGGMDRYERIIAMHRVLQTARRPVTVARLQDELGCSRATVYRDLAFLRDGLMAPLMGDGEAGFSYDKESVERFELPGLWLNSEELHALLAAQQLLERSSGGMLSNALAPLQQRVEKLLDAHSGGKRWPVERVRVLPRSDGGRSRTMASSSRRVHGQPRRRPTS